MGFRYNAVVVALCTVLLSVIAVAYALSSVDVTALLGFGVEAEAISDSASAALGRDVFERAGQGHDGKFFFLQAMDPWLTQPQEHASLLDRPVYRAQRMFYPVLASGLGLVPQRLLPWSMLVTNIAALALGAWATAEYASRTGRSCWWGLAFPLNIGLISEFLVSGAGIVAFAFAMLAVLYIERESYLRAAVFMAASLLAREVMLLTLIGLAGRQWAKRRRIPATFVALPVGAAISWAAYLRLRLRDFPPADTVQEIGWPFVGLLGAVPQWFDRPLDFVVGVTVVLVSLVVLIHFSRKSETLVWGTLGFALLPIALTEQVWLRFFDITRAVAPLFTGYVVARFARNASAAGDPATGLGQSV